MEYFCIEAGKTQKHVDFAERRFIAHPNKIPLRCVTVLDHIWYKSLYLIKNFINLMRLMRHCVRLGFGLIR